MKLLYAPWRSEYTTSTARTKNEAALREECVFCTQLQEDNDEKNFIIKRFPHSIVMLNRYPYNAGHLLIMPLDHIGFIDGLSSEIQSELMWLVGKSSVILKEVLGAEGINVGINIGKAAGAGIPAHVHIHVLPRWIGDTNFLPTLCETKVISYDLPTIYKKLKIAFDELSGIK
jgi:ATP adenylyltransferase